MKVKYYKNIAVDIVNMHELLSLIIDIFEDTLKTKVWNTLQISKDKYITFDYHSKWICSCYLELGNTYCRTLYSSDILLNRISGDPYIKRKFKN